MSGQLRQGRRAPGPVPPERDRHGPGWHGIGWHGIGWHGFGWHGIGWHGIGWHGISWHGISRRVGLRVVRPGGAS
ncbi:hypothetical protein GCM10009681_15990 [Luedemannella helvata]|uniref:Uncharacterized protein n=1 Tax=Luedemannella helvata TaxID=349315 RepID=A0ABN2K2M7_9ACTN